MVVLAQSPSGQCAQSSSQAKIATVMLIISTHKGMTTHKEHLKDYDSEPKCVVVRSSIRSI